MTPNEILESGFDANIANKIMKAYSEIERNYVLQKWKPSELDAGHFVEAVRRALDLEFTGIYCDFNETLPPFDDNALRNYEQQSGDQSYRLLIPRALKVVYNVRNRRGVAHISDVNPNEMDATLILYTVKWVLAELIRLKSGLSIDKTQELLDRVVERQYSLIWKVGNITWVLDPAMETRDQILVLLFDNSPICDSKLYELTEHSNPAGFNDILIKLHNDRLVHYNSSSDCNCRISPRGVQVAEEIIKNHELTSNNTLTATR